MKVYRIMLNPNFINGDVPDERIKISPYIPKNALPNEDKIIKRIPCCPTIIGCIESLGLPDIYDHMVLDKKFVPGKDSSFLVYLYSAEVSADNLIQPTEDQVPDSWHTGELWIATDTEFILERTYEFKKQFDLPVFPYSRYSMTTLNDVIIDRVAADIIYGDMENFSFISLNVPRARTGLNTGAFNNIFK